MSSPSVSRLVAIALLAVGCSEIAATNPYDPASLNPLPGKLVGTVATERGSAPQGSLVTARAVDGTTTTVPLAADGTFSIEVKPADYFVSASAQGFDTQTVSGLRVQPGATLIIGTMTLSVARRSFAGVVHLEGGGDAAGSVVVLIPQAAGAVPPESALVGPGGRYRVRDVAEGPYIVRASHDDYAPAYSVQKLVSGAGETDGGELVLRPASAVVKIEASGTLGARYTRVPEVKLLLIALGDVVDRMEISEDPTFRDPALGDTDWRQFSVQAPWSLKGEDGVHTVAARFIDRSQLVTQPFTTSITIDRALPLIASVKVGDGGDFVRAPAAVPVHIVATDTLSGVASWALATDGMVDTEAFTVLDATTGSTAIDTTVDLGNTRGSRRIAVVVRDAAGNESAPLAATTFVDVSAPTPGEPAVLIDDGKPKASTRAVSLTFDVEGDAADEALELAVATAEGLSESAAFLPLPTTPMPFELADGPDGVRLVCVRFRDPAGNVSPEGCAQILLDTTGRVTGVVSFEGAPTTLAGATATLTNDADPSYSATATTDASGAFKLPGVPAGGGYVLTLSQPGWDEVVVRGIFVPAAGQAAPALPQLPLSRGSLRGTATLNDRPSGEYSGITVATGGQPFTATTTADGTFLLRDVPIGDYDVSARLSGYLAASFGTVRVTPRGTTDIGSRQLRRQSGGFFVCRAGDLTCGQGPLDFTGTRNVALFLTSTTATQYRVGTTSDLTGAQYQALQAGKSSYPFTLPDVEGTQTLFVQYRDATGAEQAPLSASVILDRVAPETASFTINPTAQGASAATTNDVAGHVSLVFTAADSRSGLGNIVVSNVGTAFTEPPQAFRTPLDWTIPTASDGAKTVYVQVCDRVGNCTNATTSPRRTIVLDRLAPAAAQGYGAKISGGATITGNGQVTVDVTYGTDAAAVRFSTSSTLAGATWLALDPAQGSTASYPFLLPSGDGQKTVYVQFADAAGNQSSLSPPAFAPVITLDTQPPQSPRVTVPTGGFTKLSSLPVALSAIGADKMQVTVGDFEEWSAASWVNYATGANVTLGSDKAWKIFARFRSAAGIVSSTATSEVVRDTVAPANGAISVVEGGYAKVQTVNLRPFATGADELQVSSDGTYDTEPWQPYTTALSFALVPANASPYTVKARFRDWAQNVSPDATATVAVDGTPPTLAITVNGAASGGRTNRLDVVIGATANDNTGLATYELANTADFAGAQRSTFATSASFRLDPGGGDTLRTVFARVTDLAGNAATATASITVDTAPPSGTIAIAQGTLVNTRDITLNLTRDSEVTQVAFADGALDCSSAAYAAWPVSNTKAWKLPAGDGAKGVVACFRDQAGNTSSASATTTLDLTAPVATSAPTITINGGAATATSVAVSLRFNVAGADTMRVACDDLLDAETAVPFQSDFKCNLLNTQGLRTVQARFLDAAGNQLVPADAQITLDSVAPAVPAPKPIATPTKIASLSLDWTPNVADTARYRVQVSSTNTFAALDLDTTVAAPAVAFTAADGSWFWRVGALDLAGNTSAWSATQAVVVDTIAPAQTRLTVDAAATTETAISMGWYAPGDNGNTDNLANGSTYEVRSVPGLSFNFATATPASVLPAPGPNGGFQTFSLGGLTRKTAYSFAIRTCDAAGNCSLISPTIVWTTPDRTAPAAITNLTGVIGDHQVTLNWTTPADDVGLTPPGSVLKQVIYTRAGPLLTPEDFDAAQPTSVTVGAPGSPATATIAGLQGNTVYSFAIKTSDDALVPNVSKASNVVSMQLTKVQGVRPAAAAPGEWVELDGYNFGSTTAGISFNGLVATNIAYWSNSLVRVQVPQAASSGPVAVVRGLIDSETANFTIAPSVTNVYPREATIGQTLYVSGTGFGAKTDAATEIRLGGRNTAASGLSDWNDLGLSLPLPANLSPGTIPTRVSHLGALSPSTPIRVWTSPDQLTDGSAQPFMWGAGTSPANGDTHVLFTSGTAPNARLRWRRLPDASSTWDPELDPLGVAPAATYVGVTGADLEVDGNGAVHTCATVINGASAFVYYRQRNAAGTWLAPIQLYTLATATAPVGPCRVAASVAGGASYPLVVWTVGYMSFNGYPSDLYGAAGAVGGGSFAAAAQLCPAANPTVCTAQNYEGLPELAAIDGPSSPQWILSWVSGTSVGSALQLRAATSSSGLNFGSTVNVAPLTQYGSYSPQAVMEQVRGYAGWYQAGSVVLAWNEPGTGSGRNIRLASSRDLFSIATPWLATTASIVDADASTTQPAIAVTRDGDVSVLVVGRDVVAGGTELVVRHHVTKWAENNQVWNDVGGETIAGLSTSLFIRAAGGTKGLVNAFWTTTNSPFPRLRAARTRLPYRDPGLVTVATPGAGRQFGSPVGAVTGDGTMHTLYIDEDAGYPPLNARLMYVREADGGAITAPVQLATNTPGANAGQTCRANQICKDLMAIVAVPNADGSPGTTAAAAWHLPTPNSASPITWPSTALLLCPNAASCGSPLTVDSGAIGRVRMASDAAGGLHLAWQKQTSNGPGVFYAKWTAATSGGPATLSTPIQVNVSSAGVDPGEARDPDIVVPPSGTPHIVYRRVYGSNVLRMKMILPAIPGTSTRIVSPPTDLVTSSGLLERPTAAWSGDGISLAWRQGGQYVNLAKWQYGWIESPFRGTTWVQGGFSLGATIDGGVFVHYDIGDPFQYAWFQSFEDLYPAWRPVVSHGPNSDATRGTTDISMDPRGRVNLFGTDAGPLRRLRYWLGSW